MKTEVTEEVCRAYCKSGGGNPDAKCPITGELYWKAIEEDLLTRFRCFDFYMECRERQILKKKAEIYVVTKALSEGTLDGADAKKAINYLCR